VQIVLENDDYLHTKETIMSFMRDDEFIVLVILNPLMADYIHDMYVPSVDDRKRFRDVGMQSVFEYPLWYQMNPNPTEYNWSEIETMLSRNRAADMKTIFTVGGWLLPSWIPSGWYAKRANGNLEKESLSIWNEEAQEYSDRFYWKLVDTFAADDVLFVFGEFQGGEGIYQSGPCFYDNAALESYKKHYGSSAYPDIKTPETLYWYGQQIIEYIMRKQRVFYGQHHEIWNSQQYLMDVWSKDFGNFCIPEIFETFRAEWPDGNLVFSQFTYFDQAHYEIPNEAFVDNIKNTYNAEILVEAHFAQGLKETAPKAIAKGFRGQLCGPVHHQSGYNKGVEQWMLDEIGKAHLLWLSHRG
jgi:hypothetical protein